jgi:hypothetical protein
MTDDHETAEFFTHQYRIAGAARVGGQRLTDVLNDDLTSALELKDVRLYRLLAPHKLVASHVAALLYKKGILFAISGEQTGSAAERRFFKHVDTVEWDVFLTLPSFELTGKFHVRGTGDLRTMLLRWVGQFIPLTGAKAVYTFHPEEAFTGDVIIVNREYMQVIGTDKVLGH